ncbi:hypothetical protein [Mycobacteroides abscessus]|nr:hypothetical protein [Mycobacteroides abscessus]
MTAALQAWPMYSREIASDLSLYHHRSITEWLKGDMSSAELLIFLDGLPDASSFKTWCYRGGDWTDDLKIKARMVNELALARADGRGYVPELVKTPLEFAAEIAHLDWQQRRHDEVLAALQGKNKRR